MSAKIFVSASQTSPPSPSKGRGDWCDIARGRGVRAESDFESPRGFGDVETLTRRTREIKRRALGLLATLAIACPLAVSPSTAKSCDPCVSFRGTRRATIASWRARSSRRTGGGGPRARLPHLGALPCGPRLDPRQVLRGRSRGGSTLSASASRLIARGGDPASADDRFGGAPTTRSRWSALLSHCVRSDGERLDPAPSPAPSVLAEDGRGTLYALGADGVIRASPRPTRQRRDPRRDRRRHRRHPHRRRRRQRRPCGRSAPPRLSTSNPASCP